MKIDCVNDNEIKNIIIVGGGTAGWLTASHLAKKFNAAEDGAVKITLVESANIPTIGVGEGTVPSLLNSLRYFGISETDIIRNCEATFKQGIKFVNWMKPSTTRPNYYHHVFDYRTANDFDPTPYWLLGAFGDCSYVDVMGFQGRACDKGLGPKAMTNIEFAGLNGYAYHMDAAKFSELLATNATEKLGVTRVFAKIESVNFEEDGSIKAIVTDEAGEMKADFFVDCTGFSSLLLGEAMGVKFIPKDDVLFVDNALAIQVPYQDSQQPIPSYTISTAMDSGWIWDIGLAQRRGTGYVYSSKYSNHSDAEEVYRKYLRQSVGKLADELPCRRIPMKIGYREKAWVKNCVAIGLSQGFVEPLEATGLLMFDDIARMLAEQLPPTKDTLEIVAKRFNQRVKHQWDKVIEFIKLHYYLSDRDDSAFWTDNRLAETVPEALLENLSIWKERPPSEYDFVSKQEVFYKANYMYVLYGMGFNTDMSAIKGQFLEKNYALHEFNEMTERAKFALNTLPSHRDLIEKINRYGLQKI